MAPAFQLGCKPHVCTRPCERALFPGSIRRPSGGINPLIWNYKRQRRKRTAQIIASHHCATELGRRRAGSDPYAVRSASEWPDMAGDKTPIKERVADVLSGVAVGC